MNVVVRSAHSRPVRELVGDKVEALEELRFFAGAQHAGAAEGVHPRLAGENILRPEPVIDRETAV
jgi:hypothetical protein